MTIKELYTWACENELEDFDIMVISQDDGHLTYNLDLIVDEAVNVVEL